MKKDDKTIENSPAPAENLKAPLHNEHAQEFMQLAREKQQLLDLYASLEEKLILKISRGIDQDLEKGFMAKVVSIDLQKKEVIYTKAPAHH